MKKCLRTMSIFLCAIVLLSNMSIVSYAETWDNCEGAVAPCKIGDVQQVAFDQYSGKVWPSLTAAKDYYGYDWTYNSCYKYYNGTLYNYYYSFSDGSKMYLCVDYYTNDLIDSLPTEDNQELF